MGSDVIIRPAEKVIDTSEAIPSPASSRNCKWHSQPNQPIDPISAEQFCIHHEAPDSCLDERVRLKAYNIWVTPKVKETAVDPAYCLMRQNNVGVGIKAPSG